MKKVAVRLPTGQTIQAFRKVGTNKTPPLIESQGSATLSGAVNQIANNPSATPSIAGQPAPTISFEEVFHIGTLNPDNRGLNYKGSYEGAGLSISLHPDDWRAIAKLGGYPTWVATKVRNTFLDRWALTNEQEESIKTWGIDRGLLNPTIRWEATVYDSELDQTYHIHFDTLEEALEETEGQTENIKKIATVEVTPELAELTGTDAGATSGAFDLTLTIYTQQETDFDGVWWEDTYDPLSYSCPRGVILPNKVADWSFHSHQQ